MRSEIKPELRFDRGSPNTSGITQELFDTLGADLSFARARRPTGNVLTERFHGTINQEEIYRVGRYPDERSTKEEIGRCIEEYHQIRPHQSLMNFTPAYVHQLNHKSVLLAELQEKKRRTRERRKDCWTEREKLGQPTLEGGCPASLGAKSSNTR